MTNLELGLLIYIVVQQVIIAVLSLIPSRISDKVLWLFIILLPLTGLCILPSEMVSSVKRRRRRKREQAYGKENGSSN